MALTSSKNRTIFFVLIGSILTVMLAQVSARNVYQALLLVMVLYIALQIVIPIASLTIWYYFRNRHWSIQRLALLYRARCVMGALNCALASIQLNEAVTTSMQTGRMNWSLMAPSLLLLLWGISMMLKFGTLNRKQDTEA